MSVVQTRRTDFFGVWKLRGRRFSNGWNGWNFFVIVALLKFFSWMFAALPFPVAMAMGRGLGTFFGLVVPQNRSRALENLSRCFPDKPRKECRAIMWRMFANLGMNVVEMLRWLGGREAEISGRVRVQGEEHANGCLARGRGAGVLTAHIGNWDLMGLWAASRFPLTIISKTIKNEAVNRFWMERRAAAKVKIVPAHNSYRQCLRVLKENGCLGFILDQNMIAREGIFVEFFGRPACTTPGLAVLSAHAQAPVVPVFMIREPDGRHCVKIFPPIEPPADRKPESLAAATQQYTRIIEDVIRAFPDQWIWMHRRWRTQPAPGEIERPHEGGV
jgi:KDO2-lipid IV(A) lauroyltransferase